MQSLAETITLWVAVQSQWLVGFDVTGLDYCAVDKAASWLDIKIGARIFGHLRFMEWHTLEAWRKGKG